MITIVESRVFECVSMFVIGCNAITIAYGTEFGMQAVKENQDPTILSLSTYTHHHILQPYSSLHTQEPLSPPSNSYSYRIHISQYPFNKSSTLSPRASLRPRTTIISRLPWKPSIQSYQFPH